MKKVLCIIYLIFSLWITALTKLLALSFDSTIDFFRSFDSGLWGWLTCQPTKTLDQIVLRVFLRDFARNGQHRTCPTGWEGVISRSWGPWWAKISSLQPLLLAVCWKDTRKFTGGIWQNFFDYSEFLTSTWNFSPNQLCKDKQIITTIGFAHQRVCKGEWF